MKCIFYEATRKTTCPFHTIEFKPVKDERGSYHHLGFASRRKQPLAKRKRTARLRRKVCAL